MRLFTAAYPSLEAVADLDATVSRLALSQPRPEGGSLRRVPPDQWHVTLVYLGEADPGQAEAAQAALAATAQGALDPDGGPLRLRLAGGGRFDNGAASPVWLGLRGDVDRLQALVTRLRGELTRAGLPFDPRPYQPHLTIGRPGERLPPADLEADLRTLDAYEGPEWTVGELTLMRSEHPVSNAYAVLATAPLLLPC